jgi:hypothetical protein
MNVFDMRNRLVHDDDAFVRSFVDIAGERVKDVVDDAVASAGPPADRPSARSAAHQPLKRSPTCR